jgi:hypothetical protein
MPKNENSAATAASAGAGTETESAASPVDFSSLRKRVKQYEAMQAELKRYDHLKVELPSEMKAISDRLGKIGVDALSIPQPGEEHFSEEVKADLSVLQSLRTKFSLLPGCRAKLEEAAVLLALSIRNDCRLIGAGLFQVAKARMVALQGTLGLEIGRVCGGDVIKFNEALAFCIDRSDAADWKDFFDYYRAHPNETPANCVSFLEQMVALFEGGKPRPRT